MRKELYESQREHAQLAAVSNLVGRLPPLPSIVRYYDDFAKETRSIKWEGIGDVAVQLDGASIRFEPWKLGPAEVIMHHVMTDWFSRLDPHSVVINTGRLLHFASGNMRALYDLILSAPYEARSVWTSKILPRVTAAHSWALRAMLHSLCRLNIGQWSPQAVSIIRGLKSPKVDKYRVVRAGDCFLPLDHQAIIVNHIDSACGQLAADPASLHNEELREVSMLVLSFQYAFRPGQIARIEMADVKFFSTGAVHIRKHGTCHHQYR